MLSYKQQCIRIIYSKEETNVCKGYDGLSICDCARHCGPVTGFSNNQINMTLDLWDLSTPNTNYKNYKGFILLPKDEHSVNIFGQIDNIAYPCFVSSWLSYKIYSEAGSSTSRDMLIVELKRKNCR